MVVRVVRSATMMPWNIKCEKLIFKPKFTANSTGKFCSFSNILKDISSRDLVFLDKLLSKFWGYLKRLLKFSAKSTSVWETCIADVSRVISWECTLFQGPPLDCFTEPSFSTYPTPFLLDQVTNSDCRPLISGSSILSKLWRDANLPTHHFCDQVSSFFFNPLQWLTLGFQIQWPCLANHISFCDILLYSIYCYKGRKTKRNSSERKKIPTY